MEEVLQQVKDFADKAHGEQTRKYSSDRYIVHPARVMELCRPYTSSLPALAAALLHDVLEDTPVSRNEMHHFLRSVMTEEDAAQTTQLVVELTDVYTKEKYPRLNRKRRKQKESLRIEKTSGESQTIKYADIIDNCMEIAEQDPEFAPTFLNECRRLLEKIPKGNPELYTQAKEAVRDALRRVPEEYKRMR